MSVFSAVAPLPPGVDRRWGSYRLHVRGQAGFSYGTGAETLADFVAAISEGRSACERSKSPLADVFLVGYERLGRSKKGALAAAVNRERVRVATDLKKRLWILGTIGAIAPFVGLAGTVIGILIAFGELSAEGVTGGLQAVGGPISEALIVTAAGILVAVEAVVIYNIFNARISNIAIEMRLLTDEFIELLDEQEPEGDSSTGKRSKKKTRAQDDDDGDDDGDREAA